MEYIIALFGLMVMTTSCSAEYEYQEWWKSPKGQPYFDSALHVNDTGKDLICSVCGGINHPIHKKPGRGIYTNEEIIKLNPGYKKYEVEAHDYSIRS